MKRTIRLLVLSVLLLGTFATSPALPIFANTSQTYIVLYTGQAVPANATSVIAAAGGTLIYSYPAIGVAIAKSSSDSFGSALAASDASVQGVVATDRFATRLNDDNAASASDAAITPGIPAPGGDNLSGLQWDMDQISAPQARAINGGSPSVVVGDIDTGLDFTHPDLAPNVDFANSVSCIGGVPNQAPGAWLDDNGHGTHTAGTIAAAKNGIGIVGVAPHVKIAGIKAGDADGFFCL